MDYGATCFSRILVGEDEWEENLLQARALMAQQASAEVWTILGSDVESFRDRLAEWMERYGAEPGKAWLAAKVFCSMVNLPGSEAYRACDRKSVRTLLGMMRRAARSELGDEDDGEGRKRRRKSGVSEDDKNDWGLLFGTLSRMSDHLDVNELAEFFISVGLRMNSSDALRWVESMAHVERKRVALLRTLLNECLKLVQQNNLVKDTMGWVLRALAAMTKDKDDLLLAFCQRLASKVEAATQVTRTKLAELIVSSLHNSPAKERFVTFCGENLIVGDKPIKRILACELLSNLLATHDASPQVLQNLGERTLDSTVTVRCAALRAISVLAMKRPFVLLDNDSTLLKMALQSLRTDDKPGVRKWAVKVISLCPSLDSDVLEICIQRCRDVSISVRKSAVDALGDFISRYPNSSGEAFRRGVLPLVRDDEKTVSEAALAIVRDVLFSASQGGEATSPDRFGPLLSLLYAVRSEMEMDCLGLALRQTALRTDISSVFREFVNALGVEAIMSLPTEQEANRKALWGIWLLLEKCAEMGCLPTTKVLSGDSLSEAWAAVRGMLTTTSATVVEEERVGACEAHALQRRILRVIRAAQHDRLASERRMEIGNDLLQDLAMLDRPPEVVSEMLRVLIVICESEGRGSDVVREWGLSLKHLCETTLATEFPSAGGEASQGAEMSTSTVSSKAEYALFLLGELAMLGYDPDNNGNRLVPFHIDEPVTTLIQALTSPEFVAEGRGGDNAQNNNLTRAVAFLTLGKLCVRDDLLAKRCVTVFVKELSENHGAGHEAVRSNCLLVLGDLCRRFTNVVEPYIEKISRSLGDVSAMVRKRCLLMLSGLTQEEYVRLRPSLFYRLLACAADGEDESVRQAAEYVLINGLHRRYPTLFHQNASNLVFAICGLSRLAYKPSSQDESLLMDDVAALVGVQQRFLRSYSAREILYAMVFSRLDEAQKLEICNKLRRDVFGGLLDGTIALDQFDVNVEEREMSSVTRVVADAFRILESDFSKPSSVMGSRPSGTITDEGEESSAQELSSTEAAVQRATMKIIDSLERKNLVENVIPLLVSLYSVASRERSSLVKMVVDHLKYLYELYRAECSGALAPHRDLHGLIQMELGVGGVARAGASEGKREPTPLVFQSKKEAENIVNEPVELVDANTKKPKTPKVLRRVKAMMARG